jgi:hypothetical protein
MSNSSWIKVEYEKLCFASSAARGYLSTVFSGRLPFRSPGRLSGQVDMTPFRKSQSVGVANEEKVIDSVSAHWFHSTSPSLSKHRIYDLEKDR